MAAGAEVHVLGEVSCGAGFGAARAVACAYALRAGDGWSLLAGRAAGQTHTAAPAAGADAAVWAQPIDCHYAAGALAVRARAPLRPVRRVGATRHPPARRPASPAPRPRAQGWPCLHVQVWHLDVHGRMEVLGYGFMHVPAAAGARARVRARSSAGRAPRPLCAATPAPDACRHTRTLGEHAVACPVWRPLGTNAQERAAFFLGGAAGAPPPPPAAALAAGALAAGNADRSALRSTSAGTVHARFEVIFRGVDAYGIEW